MSLTAGARLGPYEIVSPLGAGGMGEVYRAKDGRLNRTVAIKILSDESAADADRRERFEREAKAISALDHPNICALYDVGEHEGTYFLVMPCLEGQTLADRIAKGALPPDQAIRCAIEIATALDAAHRHGIIHRDLKPGNIMLTKTGVKLLDFGLAKLKKAPGPLGDTTMVKGTGIGTLLGTMPYMAPEQIEGRDVDARSDIFSLGAVIYEMVTGQRAFKGDSPASVIGAILKDEPAPMKALQPLTPSAFDHVVTTCLAKDPDERWQSAADVARELKWIASSGSAGTTTARAPSSSWRERTAWIAVTAALLAALTVSLSRRPVASTGAVARLSVNPPAGTRFTALTSATVPTPQFAVSPDGRSIAFVASADELGSTLWLRSVDEVDAKPLSGTEGAREPFWSPENDWIGFFDDAGTMKRIQVTGGTVRSIAARISDPRGASWGKNDEIVFGTGYGGLYIVPAGGGEPRALTQLDRSKGEGSHRWPQFLPGGQHFLFTVRSGLAEQRGAYAASRDGTVKRLLIATEGDVQFVAPNRVLFLDGDTLLSQALDLERFQLIGVATPVAANVARSSRGNGAFSGSNAGTLAYASPSLRPSRLTWFNRDGTTSGVVGPSGDHDYVDFRLSPDETRLAMSLVDPKTSLPDIWLADLVRGGATPFTFGPNLNSAPVWSPAGDRIAFRSNRRGLTEIYEKSSGAGGSDQPFLLEDVARRAGVGSSNMVPTDWSADGKFVALATNAPSDIWLASTGPDKAPARVVGSIGEQMHANFSPDGRFLAYTSTESGRRVDVYVETLPPSDRKWPISNDGGYEPRWRSDGKEIYYLSRDGVLMAVPVSAGATTFGVPRPLFQTHVYPGASILHTHYVPNRDGSRFLVSVRSGEPVPMPITVVLNWTEGLKK